MRMIPKLAPLAAVAALAACAGGAEPVPPGGDECRAGDYQHLVGRPKSEIPQTPKGETWRVACTTCPMTMDYNPRRLNFVFDEADDRITKVSCG